MLTCHVFLLMGRERFSVCPAQ